MSEDPREGSADVDLDELLNLSGYYKRTLQPVERVPQEHRLTIVSVDDHIVETDETFRGRVPAKFADSAPRIVEHKGGDAWLIDGKIDPIVSGNSLVSWPLEQRDLGLVKLEDMRPGTWDARARVADMDLEGVWASVLFPSINFGFAGQRLSQAGDAEAGLAFVRAYNDWMLEEIAGAYPARFILSQIPWFQDVGVAAGEILRNAERGFKAVHFTENPEKLGFPSIHSGYWDPFFRACEETDTVINLHLGSSSHVIRPSSDSPYNVVLLSIYVNPILASLEWVFSEIPVRFPGLKMVLSEGGIDWVPQMITILDSEDVKNQVREGWSGGDLWPNDVFLRNFWFAALFDRFAYEPLRELCSDHVLLERDYPHGGSPFPNSQSFFEDRLSGLPEAFVEDVTFRNALTLYRHPMPDPAWQGASGTRERSSR